MSTPEYDAYLASAAWREKAKQRMAFDRWRCCNCHVREHLQVHHWYDQRDGESLLGHERLEDLVTLCDQCHLVMTQRRQQVFGTGPVARRHHGAFWAFVVVLVLYSLLYALITWIGGS